MVSGSMSQRGGFAIGLVVGLLIGLTLALGVAIYVTKVPVPFVDKVPQRNAGQDAADAEKNRNWDPNAALSGKSAGRSASGVIGDAAPAAAPAVTAASTPPATTAVAVPASAPTLVNPSGLGAVPARNGNTNQATGSAAAAASAAAASAAARSDAGGQYLVQVGAYARTDDAEQQRAKLAIAGLVARVSERDQAGKVMYRVRLGPFDTREEADAAREQAIAAGYAESTLVRAPR